MYSDIHLIHHQNAIIRPILLCFVTRKAVSIRKRQVVRKDTTPTYKKQCQILRNMHKAKNQANCIDVCSLCNPRLCRNLCTRPHVILWWCRLVSMAYCTRFPRRRQPRLCTIQIIDHTAGAGYKIILPRPFTVATFIRSRPCRFKSCYCCIRSYHPYHSKSRQTPRNRPRIRFRVMLIEILAAT